MLHLLENPPEEHQPAMGKKGHSKLACSFFILAWPKEKQTTVGQASCKYALVIEPELLAQQASRQMDFHCLVLENPPGEPLQGQSGVPGIKHPAWQPHEAAGLHTFLLRALTCCLA